VHHFSKIIFRLKRVTLQRGGGKARPLKSFPTSHFLILRIKNDPDSSSDSMLQFQRAGHHHEKIELSQEAMLICQSWGSAFEGNRD
jgi:hypothetical protein